jgi:hypothetical protein
VGGQDKRELMTDLHDGKGEGEDGGREGGESRSILQGTKKVGSGSDIRLIILLRSSRNTHTRTPLPLSTNVRKIINATNPVMPPRLVIIFSSYSFIQAPSVDPMYVPV